MGCFVGFSFNFDIKVYFGVGYRAPQAGSFVDIWDGPRVSQHYGMVAALSI